MLVIRQLTNVGVSLALLLIVGQPVIAQTPLTKTDKNQRENLVQATPDPAQAEDLLPVPDKDDTTNKYQAAPNYLNNSGNPLLFPTLPSEVDIKAVQPLTLNQAIELALKNNKELQGARLQLEQAQAQLDEQEARLYPTLDSQFNFSRDSSIGAAQQNLRARRLVEGTGVAPQTFPKESTNATGQLSLVYNLYTGGERAARIRVAEQQIQNQQLEVERLAEETRLRAGDNYYQLQRSDAQVAIAQAAIEDATQSLRDAQLLEQAGLGTRFSVLQAEVDVARANQDLTTAISDQRIARRTLVELLSLGQQVELTAADPIEEAGNWPLSLEESIILAYKNRAELQQQLVQREISEQNRKIALSEIRPKVDLSANYEYADNFDDEIAVVDGYSFATTARWRFFDGGAAFARARQQERNIDLANNQFARIRNQVRLQVEQAYYSSVANQENIQTAALSVESATESLRLARLRFQAGVGTQTDVINSQRDLTDARSRYLQAIVDYNRSLNELQRAVSNWPDGRLFELR